MDETTEETGKGNLRLSVLGCGVLLAFLPVLCILAGVMYYSNPENRKPQAEAPAALPNWDTPTEGPAPTSVTAPSPAVTASPIPSPTAPPVATPTFPLIEATGLPSPIAEVRGCVEASSIHVRARPRSSAPSIDYLLRGECARLLARNPDSSWVQIMEGWVSVYFLKIEGDLESLPVVQIR